MRTAILDTLDINPINLLVPVSQKDLSTGGLTLVVAEELKDACWRWLIEMHSANELAEQVVVELFIRISPGGPVPLACHLEGGCWPHRGFPGCRDYHGFRNHGCCLESLQADGRPSSLKVAPS